MVIIGLLVPFAALFSLTALRPLSQATIAASAPPAPQSAGASPDSILDPRPGAPFAQPQPGPLFAAGDGEGIWLARPMAAGDHKTAAFELLRRANNSGAWAGIRPGGAAYFGGLPQGLSVLPATHNLTAYVYGPGGRLTALSPDRFNTMASLPATHRLRAVTPTGIFALTDGPPDPSTTRPGDRLDLNGHVALLPYHEERPPAIASTATAPATAAALATAPAGTALEPATSEPASLLNAYAYRGAEWIALPPLGSPGTPEAPGAGAHVALADAHGRLFAMWIDPDHPTEIAVRARPDDQPDAPWTPVIRSPLPEPLRGEGRLEALSVGHILYAIYPVPAGKSYALLAVRIGTTPQTADDLRLLGDDPVHPMFLGPAAEGVHPDADITVAISENAFVVVMASTDGILRSAQFDSRGTMISPPRPVNLASGIRDLGVGQNVGLMLVVLLMAVSLWRWRRDPQAPTLPEGMRTAPLPARGAAFLIDIAIPFLLVVTAMGLWANGGYWTILDTWGAAITKPDQTFASIPLLIVLGVYTLHVAVGELFFGRSIGKAALGLRVLMIDGKAPTVAGVLVRNLVRLAEIVPAGILILYLFISDYRQRLGDLLAHTIVVAPIPPDQDRPQRGSRQKKEQQKEEEEAVGKR